MEAMIKSGSMDELGERSALLSNLEEMLAYNKEAGKGPQNQASLFGGLTAVKAPEFKLKESTPAKKSEMLSWEKELLGLYISGHPLERLRDKLESKPFNIKKIKEEVGNGMPITIGGMITNVKQVITKKNDRMAFVTVEDLTGSIEAVVFPKLFQTSTEIIVPEKCIALSGKVTVRNGEKSIAIEAMKEI